MAGETFSAVSSFALPKALTLAGLRAGTGAAILTSVYGPFGFRSQMRYKTLDASSGRRGTLSMSGVREIADIGERTFLQEGIGTLDGGAQWQVSYLFEGPVVAPYRKGLK